MENTLGKASCSSSGPLKTFDKALLRSALDSHGRNETEMWQFKPKKEPFFCASGTNILAFKWWLVEFLLEYVQIVGGGHGNNVVQWMPGGVDDLLVKVQAVYTDLVLLAFPPCAYFAGLQDGPRLAVFPRRLQSDVLPVAAVEHSEEVVVGTGHHDAAEGKRSLMVLPHFLEGLTGPVSSVLVDIMAATNDYVFSLINLSGLLSMNRFSVALYLYFKKL